MPAMFALTDKGLGNPIAATFAAFGSFAMLLLVDFGGPLRDRLRAQLGLALSGAALICLATATSRETGLAAAAMTIVAFCVIFAGVISSVLAAATTSLLLAFILPVTVAGPISSIPDRLLGWGIASAASLLAISLLWPAPARNPLRTAAIEACRALAVRLRAEIAVSLHSGPAAEYEDAARRSERSVEALQSVFTATPYRPSGLTTAARTVMRLVDELRWLNAVILQALPRAGEVNRGACAVKRSAAAVLEACADLLEEPAGSVAALNTALAELRRDLDELERSTSLMLPSSPANVPEDHSGDFVSALDPSFRAQELSFVVSQIAANVELAAAAERRTWLARALGRQPAGLSGRLAAAQQRAGAHLERHSLWLQNSLRGAAGLGLAVLVADWTGVQHAFWVAFGTLSVLRSNALSTGESILRSLLGTVAGFVIGALLVWLVGTNTALLWILLAPAVLLAGVAPAAIGFATGQAGFTLTVLILFNILQPAGWKLGLVRVDDVALGCAVSLAVGLLLWPRGAGSALGQVLAAAYVDSAAYLAGAVRFAIGRGEGDGAGDPGAPIGLATQAAAASRRLDDAYRSYLAEGGSKPIPLAAVTGLVNGVSGLWLAAEAVLDLWDENAPADGEQDAARRELLATSSEVASWFDGFAASLRSGTTVPTPAAYDGPAGGRLVRAVDRHCRSAEGGAAATAVRLIWTADHLDAARRLQSSLASTATAVVEQHAFA
jgi:uncharacterized membrane protein YccC